MPELPEVETIKRDLSHLITQDTLLAVEVRESMVLGNSEPSDFVHCLVGRTVEDVQRIGKMLRIRLGADLNLLVHLRMTGKIVSLNGQTDSIPDDKGHIYSQEKIDKHTHVIFNFNRSGPMGFSDIRKFGRLYLLSDDDIPKLNYIRTLGIEPFSEQFTPENLDRLLKSCRQMSLKIFLLDQHRIAGLGNIYASEVLFAAGLSPLRAANSLDQGETERLHGAILSVLSQAITCRGTTFSDYRDVSGSKGSYHEQLRVYQRTGQACLNCDGLVEAFRQNGRRTFWCRACQH